MLKTTSLTQEVKEIVVNKGTEYCYSGIYDNFVIDGTYLCRNCGLALFSSKDKFHSGSGWPSFDREIKNNINKVTDLDNVRTELLCSRCNAHLGHIFYGEGHTEINTRYCINSLALEFVPYENVTDTEEAILAAGCFWGVEHLFKKLKGVLKTEAGYTGGFVKNPNYELVCKTSTGHIEAVRVIYDPSIIEYPKIIQYFFEIHDFTQVNGQGGDIGEQYLSKIFYFNNDQYVQATNMINLLKSQGYRVATCLEAVKTFWAAEGYHQEYYDKSGGEPYCHTWKKIF
jgi:peptide methionine sulfoxide reductase msrA/msrB